MSGLPLLLEGVRVLEIANERSMHAGKMLALYGADVLLLEPPGGHHTRAYQPFLDDVPGPDRSLWFWHYNTSKRNAIVDLTTDAGRARFAELVAQVDVVLEGEDPGALAALGIDEAALRAANPRLVWASVTPFKADGPRAHELATDLTLQAGGGIAWNNGYDDHTLPPQRGAGNQAFQTGSVYAVMGILTALVSRDVHGTGQRVEVDIHAAVNVTTEAGSYEWLVARSTVQRLTCRHAALAVTTPSLARAADGRLVHTGVPPRAARDFEALYDWLVQTGFVDEFVESFFIQMGVDRGGVNLAEIATDPEAAAIFGAGRDALTFLAEHLPSQEFFLGGQSRGLTVGVVNSPEEAMADPHLPARGFVVQVEHPELGRSLTYPGLPFRGTEAGGAVRRAPLLGDAAR